MKYVYVISPDFLRPLVEESKDYSFAIRGYYSVEEGINNLKFSNMDDLLGFVILFKSLPRRLTPLVNFINHLDFLCDKPVVLASMDKSGMNLVINNVTHDNIKLFLCTPIMDMTDLVIKRDLFGTIVRESFSPYKFKELDNKTLNKKDFVHSKFLYESILNKDTLLIAEPVIKAMNVNMSLESDPVLRSLSPSNPMHYLRTLKIFKYYNIDKDSDLVFQDLVKDRDDKILLKGIYNLVKKGRI